MNCLDIDPKLLKKKISYKLRSYNYDCFDLLKEYKISQDIYYDYLLSIESFKLKNIWNILVKSWNKMKKELSNNIEFNNSIYSKTKYNLIHNNIDDEKLNSLFKEFIDKNYIKSFFVCNIIQKCITPK